MKHSVHSRDGIKNFSGEQNQFQGSDSANLNSLAGRYDNPIPTRFLALIDCSKIQALKSMTKKSCLEDNVCTV
jgi:hypothetical protein